MKAPEDERCRGAASAAAFGAVVMLLFAPASGAAEWTVLPRLSLSETYTDNVRLGGGFGGVGGFGGGGMQEGISLPRSIRAESSGGGGAALTSTLITQ